MEPRLSGEIGKLVQDRPWPESPLGPGAALATLSGLEPLTVEQMYGPGPLPYEEVLETLDRSLHPRSADSLFETVAASGVGGDDHVLDIGARDARHSLVLAERFGCRVTAIDPVETHITDALAAVGKSQHGDLVEVVRGQIEDLPVRDGVFDLVFCRDVLSHIADLGAALGECHRALAPGGRMVIYQTFATDWMEPAEAARLYPDLVVVPESMDPARLEQGAVAAGFVVEDVDVVGSEWRESWEEDGSGRTSRQLLQAARLIRHRAGLLEILGEVDYRVELANSLWGIYQMIGKLEPRIYVMRKPSAEDAPAV